MKEYYTRLKDKNGLVYSPGDFWSIVSSMGWLAQLEKQTIEKIRPDQYEKEESYGAGVQSIDQHVAISFSDNPAISSIKPSNATIRSWQMLRWFLSTLVQVEIEGNGPLSALFRDRARLFLALLVEVAADWRPLP